eukprot:Skav229535  [mRNA]  locus=scaffold568:12140:14902:+ [translate_table: standard]
MPPKVSSPINQDQVSKNLNIPTEAKDECPHLGPPSSLQTSRPDTRSDDALAPPNTETNAENCPNEARSNTQQDPNPPYGLISLFDGCGSTFHILSQKLGYPPAVTILSEIEHDLREIISETLRISSKEGWQYIPTGEKIYYLADVDGLFTHSAKLLQQFAHLLPKGSKVYVIAGSPCVDLTIGETDKGWLGITGPSSVYFYTVYLALHVLLRLLPATHIQYLVENAGSMKSIHFDAIMKVLNVNHMYTKHLLWCTSCITPTKRSRYFFQNLPQPKPTKREFDSVRFQFNGDWGPLLFKRQGRLIAIPSQPFMKPRARINGQVVRYSWSSYHPTSLLYHYPSFGGPDKFASMCKLNPLQQIPFGLPWNTIIPPLYKDAWANFLRGINTYNNDEKDQVVDAVLPLFHNPNIWVPFRVMTDQEALQISGLQPFLKRNVKTAHLLDSFAIRSLVGNSFHPLLISWAIGTKEANLEWLRDPASQPLRLPGIQEVIAVHNKLVQDIQKSMPVVAKKHQVLYPFRSIQVDFVLSFTQHFQLSAADPSLPLPMHLSNRTYKAELSRLNKERVDHIGKQVTAFLESSTNKALLAQWNFPCYHAVESQLLLQCLPDSTQAHPCLAVAASHFCNFSHEHTLLQFMRVFLSHKTHPLRPASLVLCVALHRLTKWYICGAEQAASIYLIVLRPGTAHIALLSYSCSTPTLAVPMLTTAELEEVQQIRVPIAEFADVGHADVCSFVLKGTQTFTSLPPFQHVIIEHRCPLHVLSEQVSFALSNECRPPGAQWVCHHQLLHVVFVFVSAQIDEGCVWIDVDNVVPLANGSKAPFLNPQATSKDIHQNVVVGILGPNHGNCRLALLENIQPDLAQAGLPVLSLDSAQTLVQVAAEEAAIDQCSLATSFPTHFAAFLATGPLAQSLCQAASVSLQSP